VLLVNSLEAHREVIQTKSYSFNKPKFFEKLVGEFAGKGVLFSEGAEHKLQRRFLAGKYHKRSSYEDVCVLRCLVAYLTS
jgi:cytochrome P450